MDENGWAVTDDDVVDVLWSVRIGPTGKRGRRNYHLVYLGAGQVLRTLEIAEVIETLRKSVPRSVMANAHRTTFYPGSILQLAERLLVLPGEWGPEKARLIDSLTNRGFRLLSSSFFNTDTCGRLSIPQGDGSAKLLACITSFNPEGKLLRPRQLTPGEATTYFFTSSPGYLEFPSSTMQASAALAQRSVTLKGRYGRPSQAADYLGWRIRTLPGFVNL